MDRLSAIAIAALALAACDKSQDQAPPPSRTEGAKVNAGQHVSTDAFCDVHKTDDSGPLLQIPPVGEVKVIGPVSGHWLWLNIWATWCKPCVEEMPRIAKWRDQLASAGKQVDLAFVSIDDNDADVTAFQQAHGGLPHTARLADSKTQSPWFQQLGLDANPPIPIHIFISPTGHVRCARAGNVREQDYAAIAKLLSE